MSTNVQPTNGKKAWIWPAAFVGGIALVMFISNLGHTTDLNGAPILTSADDYSETLKKANDLFQTVIKDDGKTLSADQIKSIRDDIQLYDELNTFNPTKMGPYFASGRLHIMLQEYPVAAEKFQQALNNSAQPDNDKLEQTKQLRADSHWYLAVADEGENDFPSALNQVNESIKFNSNRPDYLYTRARAYIQLKRIPEAIADLQKSIKLQPDNPAAASLLNFISRANSSHSASSSSR